MSKTSENAAKVSGAAAGVAGLAMPGLKAAGISAVKHPAGKMIATNAALYVGGKIGLLALAIATLPALTAGLTAVTVALTAAEAIKQGRGGI